MWAKKYKYKEDIFRNLRWHSGVLIQAAIQESVVVMVQATVGVQATGRRRLYCHLPSFFQGRIQYYLHCFAPLNNLFLYLRKGMSYLHAEPGATLLLYI